MTPKAQAIRTIIRIGEAINRTGSFRVMEGRQKEIARAFTQMGITEKHERFECAKEMGFDIVSATRISEVV